MPFPKTILMIEDDAPTREVVRMASTDESLANMWADPADRRLSHPQNHLAYNRQIPMGIAVSTKDLRKVYTSPPPLAGPAARGRLMGRKEKKKFVVDVDEKLLTAGDGAIWSNLVDMANWDKAVLANRFLTPETMRRARSLFAVLGWRSPRSTRARMSAISFSVASVHSSQ